MEVSLHHPRNCFGSNGCAGPCFLVFLGRGLGLASAHRVRTAADFASWVDSLIMVRKRHPQIAATMVRNLEVGPVQVSNSFEIARMWWWLLGSMCPPGMICRCRVQWRRHWSPTNPSLGGNNRRQSNWKRNSFLTTFDQGSTTLRGR